jgi:hypothetical protein
MRIFPIPWICIQMVRARRRIIEHLEPALGGSSIAAGFRVDVFSP